ncbi:hypothetical protein SFUMM280S_00274 [Streptomyces fumanus]
MPSRPPRRPPTGHRPPHPTSCAVTSISSRASTCAGAQLAVHTGTHLLSLHTGTADALANTPFTARTAVPGLVDEFATATAVLLLADAEPAVVLDDLARVRDAAARRSRASWTRRTRTRTRTSAGCGPTTPRTSSSPPAPPAPPRRDHRHPPGHRQSAAGRDGHRAVTLFGRGDRPCCSFATRVELRRLAYWQLFTYGAVPPRTSWSSPAASPAPWCCAASSRAATVADSPHHPRAATVLAAFAHDGLPLTGR